MKGQLLLALLSLCSVGLAAPKYVFAHWMQGYSYGATVDFYGMQIRKAQALGIDAFAVNLGGDSAQIGLTYMFFQAANANNFKLFISFDMTAFGASPRAAPLTNYINLFANNPAYFRFNNTPFVSTFAGYNTDLGLGGPTSDPNTGWTAWRNQLNTPIYFCPSWSGWGPSYEIYDHFPVMDCHFPWDGWAVNGGDRSTVDDVYSKEDAAKNHKTWMAGVPPNFFVHIEAYSKNWLYGSERLLPERWLQMIELQPDFVEIITWNDYSESTYIITPEAVEVPVDCQHYIYLPVELDHAGFGYLSSYYIEWYKTGIQPSINQDQFFWWYRTHPKAQWRNDTYAQPTGWDTADDWIYVHAITANPSAYTVFVTIGNITTSKPLGSNNTASVYFPYTSTGGTIQVSLTYNGAPVFYNAKGPKIDGNGNYTNAFYNFNFWVGNHTIPSPSITVDPNAYVVYSFDLSVSGNFSEANFISAIASIAQITVDKVYVLNVTTISNKRSEQEVSISFYLKGSNSSETAQANAAVQNAITAQQNNSYDNPFSGASMQVMEISSSTRTIDGVEGQAPLPISSTTSSSSHSPSSTSPAQNVVSINSANTIFGHSTILVSFFILILIFNMS